MKIQVNCKSPSSFYLERSQAQMAYLNDIRRYPPISKEEEYELLYTLKHSRSEEEKHNAKNKLIESNLRFVISIVKKLGNSNNFLDLVNEGNLGLAKAIDKFDMKQNCRLLTYAAPWIISYIRSYQITKVKAIVPPNTTKTYSYVRNVKAAFYKEFERDASNQEVVDMIKDKYNFNINNLDDVSLGSIVSISETYEFEDSEKTFEEAPEYVKKTSTNNIQEDIDKENEKFLTNYFLGKLDDRERFVVERSYGINCLPESFETIGYELNLSGERVRQICTLAIKKMQKFKEDFSF